MTRATMTMAAILIALIAGMFNTVYASGEKPVTNIVNTDTTKRAVMLSIAGQTGDASFDNAWHTLANDCTVIIVIDDSNDPLSPYIYTRLACQMTQTQIDNAPEIYGDSLLALTPLYTVALPIIVK